MITPLISEKSIAQQSNGKYTFMVDKALSKPEIAKLVKKIFNVEVVNVNKMTRQGKVKRVKQTFGRRSNQAIAIVTLKENQKIDGFDFPVEETPKPETKDKKSDKKTIKESK